MFIVLERCGANRAVFALAARDRATIGRSTNCDVVVDDKRVSRVHASVERIGTGHLLRDEDSANGTFVNGHRLGPGMATLLRPSDLLRVGAARLRYLDTPTFTDPSAPAPALEQIAHGPRYEAFDLEELVESGRGLTAELIAEIAGPSRPRMVQSIAVTAASRTDADAAALFLGRRKRELKLAAAHPSPAMGASLLRLSEQTFGGGDGRLGAVPWIADAPPSETTICSQKASGAAVAVLHRGDTVGVLAVGRSHGGALGLGQLVVLAALSTIVVDALAAAPSSENDTRI